MGNRIILNIRGVKWELVSFSRDSAPMSPINFRQQETTSEDATFEQRSVLAEAV
jgi:hypothetical protein